MVPLIAPGGNFEGLLDECGNPVHNNGLTLKTVSFHLSCIFLPSFSLPLLFLFTFKFNIFFATTNLDPKCIIFRDLGVDCQF